MVRTLPPEAVVHVRFTASMYPGAEVLQEVGRVTIAGAHLDVWMGLLWHHLDRSQPEDNARGALGSVQRKAVKRLAGERLVGPLQAEVLAAVEAAEQAQRHRNEIVHQDWLLRGSDATRPVAELSTIPAEDLPAYLEEWERESKDSPDWLRVPRDTTAAFPAQGLDDLRRVERELAAGASAVQQLTFRVASARETGQPAGYVHPS
jgi:hypothetical protein